MPSKDHDRPVHQQDFLGCASSLACELAYRRGEGEGGGELESSVRRSYAVAAVAALFHVSSVRRCNRHDVMIASLVPGRCLTPLD